MADTDRSAELNLDDSGLPAPTPEVDQERRVAIYDLLEENSFALPGRAPGPYALNLAVRDRRLVFDIRANGAQAAEFHLSLAPSRQIIKD